MIEREAMVARGGGPRDLPAYGPWLVALGAGLWGTESAWRIPLNDVFDGRVMVFLELVLLVAMFLPFILRDRRMLATFRASTWGYLVFSGIAGSAVGTVLFTEALRRGNPSVVNVILNVQPVVSTTGACIVFGDRLARGFFVWAPIAILSGAVLCIGDASDLHLSQAGGAGTWLALACALCWGLATVAARGVMLEVPLMLASGLRVAIGLIAMAATLVIGGQMNASLLWPARAAASPGPVLAELLLLVTASSAVPLVVYFQGLKLTRASTAGYFEMMQTLTGVAITWGFFGASLSLHQVLAGITLMIAVALVQRAQSRVA